MKVKEAFTKISKLDEYVALAVVDSKDYQKTNTELIKSFSDKKIPGVYITLSKPYQTLVNIFKKSKIDPRTIIFIDAVTKTAGGEIEKKENCLFIGTPENLSDIGIAMDQAVQAIGKQKFVFFDSLSTLLIYNDAGSVAKFIHFLASKMRVWKVKGIIVSLKRKEDDKLIREILQFCDVMLDIK